MGINVSHPQHLTPRYYYMSDNVQSVLFTHSLYLQSCRSVRPAWWLHSKWAVYNLFILIQRMFSVLGKIAVLDLRCFSRLMVNTWVLYRLISYWRCRFPGFHLIYAADSLSSYVTVHWMCLWSGDHSAVLVGTAGGTLYAKNIILSCMCLYFEPWKAACYPDCSHNPPHSGKCISWTAERPCTDDRTCVSWWPCISVWLMYNEHNRVQYRL